MTENLMKIKNLSVSFTRKKNVLDGIDLEIKRGKIYGIIGNNGAGKTTLLKAILGFLKPTSGEIYYVNDDLKKRMGALIERPGLYGDMNAYQNLKAKALCLGRKYSKQEILSMLETVGLGDVGKKKVHAFSMGMKQRLGIAVALLDDPEILILDEPINGLDPQGIAEVRSILLKIYEERNITMLISSHILDELARTATDFCVINRGKVVKNCTKEEFLAECGDMSFEDYYLKLVTEPQENGEPQEKDKK